MSYEQCLIMAGAKVHAFEYFGDYGGTWYAYVTHNGQTGVIVGSYGTCSGCDAYEAEHPSRWEDEGSYQERLDKFQKEFGEDYLKTIRPLEDVIKETEAMEWKDELELAWLKGLL